ncbi:MAG: hypothetical protein OXE05_02935 [Chloroflexi bacterium]|nr:hypothetical protein [Chloroflexota bacterium]
MNRKATWQFPPNNGGSDVVQDPSSPYFSDAPVPKLVREVIQNSLDAQKRPPVEVTFAETRISGDLIDTTGLKKHLTACLDRTKREDRTRVRKVYERALKALKSKQIQCLQIVDSGTTGLEGEYWDELVNREGGVKKSGGAPGGSYGIGKNAVFNVSDLRTVFYSTRYVSGKEGRVDKLQGKATLMAHPDPSKASRVLRHIGFYRDNRGDPIHGTDIPGFFKLDRTGTGVFIMGFNPRSTDWVNEVRSAVIENFFYAIHHKRLVVHVSPAGSDKVVVSHETLDHLFPRERPSHYYYRAIRDKAAIQTPNLGQVGILNVHLIMGSGPRRTAYVNRNGMLVTDSREQKSNPIAPRGRSLWPDYAAVIVPATDDGDAWIREMENPSHDSVSPGELWEPKEQRRAEESLRITRDSIRNIIDKEAQIAQYGDTTNLQELAEIFPDEMDPTAPGNEALITQTIRTRGPQAQAQLEDESDSDDTGLGDTDEGETEIDRRKERKGGKRGKRKRKKQGEESARPPRVRNARIIPVGKREVVVAFTTTADAPIRLALRLAGSERKQEEKISITDVTVVSPTNQGASLDDGCVVLAPNTNERIMVRIVADRDVEGKAFTLG